MVGIVGAAVAVDVGHRRRRNTRGTRTRPTHAAAADVTGQGGEVGSGDQDRTFVPDGADTDTARTTRLEIATASPAATTATAGSDVVGNGRVADDPQGRAGIVVEDRKSTRLNSSH